MIEKGSIIENVLVTAIANEGKAIARIDNFVLFVEDAVPGDIADVKIFRKKKNFAEGKAVNIVKKSINRIEPFCSHFGTCGGCKWQHLTYEKQLEFKQQQVIDAFERIGKMKIPPILPILGSEKTRHYRNKLEFTFSNKAWLLKEDFTDKNIEIPALGFHVPLRFDKILDIKSCFLQDDFNNTIRLEVKKFCIENGYSFFNLIQQNGDLRNLIVRNSSTGEWMVVVVFYTNDSERISKLMEHLKSKFPEITSLQYVINQKRNDTIFDLDVHLFHGRDHILEKMENLTFRISAKSFYQTNSMQALELYKIVRNFTQLTGKENVYDLYTGTGTIASFVSGQARKVTGIDFVDDAIKDANQNALDNNLKNLTFYSGDIKGVLNDEFINKNGRPDVIITDPPRSGMHEDVILSIKKTFADRIVYVSCNPVTQARDLQLLNDEYRIEKIQPVDMFPHTSHVENVVLLKKINENEKQV